MELEAVLLHQLPDAEHRLAVLEHQEPSIHAEVSDVHLELALGLDDAVRRSQAHVGARPHAIEYVARQRVVRAEVVGRPGISYSDDQCPVLAREDRRREELFLGVTCQRPATNGSRRGSTWSYTLLAIGTSSAKNIIEYKAEAVRHSSMPRSSENVCMERSGTVPQHDLTSVVLWLANGPSEDAGAELYMERSGTVPQQDLTSVRIMGGVTAMHGLAPLGAQASCLALLARRERACDVG